ncbi:DUF6483 family protein [Mediterraneibacter sp.]|jgi:hypothetical protein|uniref:DUF6483 family protein n=1 Tax=Mediterraneibacter sp. TaxID=2316022 RepID=UPI0027B90370|nr:DUF6483 family protein [Mediterraneibacter sp.]
MGYTDEKDYIMRMIKEMARVLFSLAFGKTFTAVELENEDQLRVSGKSLREWYDMVDRGEINEAENLLLDEIHYEVREDVMAAALFYQYVSEKEENFLQEHRYSKEEVLFGMEDLMKKSGYQDLLNLLERE